MEHGAHGKSQWENPQAGRWGATAGPRYQQRQITPFEKQFLACYKALGDTEHLTNIHQDGHLKLASMTWVLLEASSHKHGRAWQQSVRWKYYLWD